MVGVKFSLLLLLLAILVVNSEKHSSRNSLARRLLQNLKHQNSEAVHHARRHHLSKATENKDETDSNRRSHEKDVNKQNSESPTTLAPGTTDKGPVITLQNRAAMNTRLRVLYTDDDCQPFLAESGLLMTSQTKSVTLPVNAQNIKIIVEKDMFAENWRLVYNGTLTGASKCIRIIGVTVSSPIKPCKKEN